jgi:lipopolysaccharide export system protein LptA
LICRLALLAVLAAPSTTRLAGVGGGVITVQASHFSYSFPNHRVEYTGAPVKLVRADSTLTCRKLTVQFNQAEQVSKATCETDVRFEKGDKVVTCQKATYEDAASRLTCEGAPEVKTGAMSAKGSLLVYDLAADEVQMTDVEGNVPAEDADAKVREVQAKRKPRQAGGKP